MAKEEKKQLLEEKNIHLWFSGSPVAICTMRLELNMEVGAIFAYSKMMNVQPEPIRDVYFDLICYDSVRHVVDILERCRYSKMDIPRNGVFGMDTPIRIRNQQTRNIEFVIKSVTTVSGDTWYNEEDNHFNMSLEQESIYNVQGDLHRQFIDNCVKKNIDHTKLIFQPVFQDLYWLCACGTLNWSDEENCSECKISREWLESNVQTDKLRTQEEKRKEEAEKVRAEAERKSIENQEKQKEEFRKRKEEYEKQRKREESQARSKKVLIVVLIVLAVLGAAYGIVFYGIPYIKYNIAVSEMNSGNFDAAIEKFQEVKGYQDSDELIKKCTYSKAVTYFYSGSRKAAADLFMQIPGYEDADEKYFEAQILIAEQLTQDGNYVEAYRIFVEVGADPKEYSVMAECMKGLYELGKSELSAGHINAARDIFLSLGKYKDSENQAKECLYRQAKKEYENTQYNKAIEKFGQIKDYKDVSKTLAKMENLSVILSVSDSDDTPSVWEAYNGKCPLCGEKAEYVCEFYQNGRCVFTVNCEKESGSQEIICKFKIDGNKIFLSDYNNGVKVWNEKGHINKVEHNKDVEGKNTVIIATDFINKTNNQAIKLYGNKIEKSE